MEPSRRPGSDGRSRQMGGGGLRQGRSGAVLPVEVARQVEGWARSGRVTAGAKLPAERELAVQLGTSRNVLREALRILQTRGVIQVRHGVGSFVVDLARPATATIPVQFDLEVSWLPVAEILTARRAIECAVVEVAARACDSFDLKELRDVLEETAIAVRAQDISRYVAADLRFHETLGRCTHNSLLETIQGEITRATAAVRDVATETHDAMRAALRFHEGIADALARSDSEAAAATMVLHLVDIGERALGALADQDGAGHGDPHGRSEPECKLP